MESPSQHPQPVGEKPRPPRCRVSSESSKCSWTPGEAAAAAAFKNVQSRCWILPRFTDKQLSHDHFEYSN